MIQFDSKLAWFWNTSEINIHSVINSILEKRWDLGFIDVDNSTDIQGIQQYVTSSWSDFDTVVILGIGGSALGTKALLESLYWKYYNEDQNKKWKNIYVLDNVDSDSFRDIEAIIDLKRTLFCFISKSGSTIETLTEYLYFKEQVQKETQDWKKHFCFIVWENCKMREKLEEDFEVFYIPENVWGRFSVFTAVGMLPIAFTGVDISLFFQGISEIKETYLSEDIEKNGALKIALVQYYAYVEEKKNITVFFPYSSRMFQMGEWYKQLMGESIGKDRKWVTLTSSLWVTDQHSQLQLFQDGPKDKLFVSLDIEQPTQDYTVHTDISWLSFDRLLKIEKYGTITSLENEDISTCNITLERIDEQHVAQLMYMLEFQIAYLWELLDVNAFDQPGVEKSKIITKQRLIQEIGEVDVFHKAFYE